MKRIDKYFFGWLVLCSAVMLPFKEVSGQNLSSKSRNSDLSSRPRIILKDELVLPGKTQNVFVFYQIRVPARGIKIAPGMKLTWGKDYWINIKIGSGFFIGEGLVFTNSHVGQPINLSATCKVNKVPVDDCTARTLVRDFRDGQHIGKIMIARVVAREEKQDILLLSVPASGASAATLASDYSTGENIYFVGNRSDALNQAFAGTIEAKSIAAGTLTIGESTYLYPLTELHIPTRDGNSGSAVRSLITSEVVGMLVARWGYAIAYMIPATELSGLLTSLEQKGLVRKIENGLNSTWTLTTAGAASFKWIAHFTRYQTTNWKTKGAHVVWKLCSRWYW